jgi:hypothetical protein
MNTIKFTYTKTPQDISQREAVVLTKPSNNYFTLDITVSESDEVNRLLEGLDEFQVSIDRVFAERAAWLKEEGWAGNFRNFSKDKMELDSKHVKGV